MLSLPFYHPQFPCYSFPLTPRAPRGPPQYTNSEALIPLTSASYGYPSTTLWPPQPPVCFSSPLFSQRSCVACWFSFFLPSRLMIGHFTMLVLTLGLTLPWHSVAPALPILGPVKTPPSIFSILHPPPCSQAANFCWRRSWTGYTTKPGQLASAGPQGLGGNPFIHLYWISLRDCSKSSPSPQIPCPTLTPTPQWRV